jgi:hypothetical protein
LHGDLLQGAGEPERGLVGRRYPEIEPGELFVRVFLRADRPEEYEQIILAFERDHQAAHVPAHLGPAGLETVDTLIMAGIADDRADAIRLVLPRFREQPEYEQLRERVREIDQLRADF